MYTKHIFIVLCLSDWLLTTSNVKRKSTLSRYNIKHVKNDKWVAIGEHSVNYEDNRSLIVSWNQETRVQTLYITLL